MKDNDHKKTIISMRKNAHIISIDIIAVIFTTFVSALFPRLCGFGGTINLRILIGCNRIITPQ